MQADYMGETYFDTNGAADYLKTSRESFRKRKPFIQASRLPGYERDFYSKTALDNLPVLKKVEPEK